VVLIWVAQGLAGLMVGNVVGIAMLAVFTRWPSLRWPPVLGVATMLASCSVGLFWGFSRPASLRRGLLVVAGITAAVLVLGHLGVWAALAGEALAAPLTAHLAPRVRAKEKDAASDLEELRGSGPEEMWSNFWLRVAADVCIAAGLFLPLVAFVVRHGFGAALSILAALAALSGVILGIVAVTRPGERRPSVAIVLIIALAALPISLLLSFVGFVFRDYVQ
jgi:hypothetical protein